jgi:branched-chain amino acid transport system permease protein
MIEWFDSNPVLIQATLVAVLLAMSLQVPMRAGVFSLAGIGCYGIGAYGTAILFLTYDFSGVAAMAAATLIAAVASLALGLLVQRLSGLYLGMATIAFNLILVVIVANGGDLTGGSSGLYGVLGDLTTPIMVVIVVLAVLAIAWSERGPVGRQVESVRSDPELALAMGINVARARIGAFLVAGVLGGLAGGMNILTTTTVAPESVGFLLVVATLTMVVVGGTRSWLGAAIGAVLFTWLPTWIVFVGEWRAELYGLLVAVVAVYAPGGLIGVVTAVWRRIEQRRIRASARSGELAIAGGGA